LVDRLTPQRRSWLMSRVRGKNTTPELRVRRLAHSLGLRFRLHRRDLPGCPDIVLPRRRVALFVHGCFWHRHPGCPKNSPPSSPFWANKFASNVVRDARVAAQLKTLGWIVVVIWECETRDSKKLLEIIRRRVMKTKVSTPKRRRRASITNSEPAASRSLSEPLCL
jgi:DNA mismatch endonuclease (patch repair protein)